MKRIMATVAIAGALTLSGATAAAALDYPAAPARGGVDTGTVSPGGAATFTGSGMTPGESVTITVTCNGSDYSSIESATVVADAQGNFTYRAVLNVPGACTLTAVGTGSGATATAQVSVVDGVAQTPTTGQGPAGGLASTGLDDSTALWGAAGIGALTLGTAALAASRHRPKDIAA
ncbi:hypothetical protein [Arthrobacter burdickii]|uniref:Sortase n=1 Tax=Arthrobacter burdickii TaxID=3035920 RepID=A0ABT8K7T5_9MICC|nr:hypothetical protein [Arthrobacter burdickii]MDN4612572.1 hypothetical protein [Arthrobacter burdickii]